MSHLNTQPFPFTFSLKEFNKLRRRKVLWQLMKYYFWGAYVITAIGVAPKYQLLGGILVVSMFVPVLVLHRVANKHRAEYRKVAEQRGRNESAYKAAEVYYAFDGHTDRPLGFYILKVTMISQGDTKVRGSKSSFLVRMTSNDPADMENIYEVRPDSVITLLGISFAQNFVSFTEGKAAGTFAQLDSQLVLDV